MNNDSGDRDYDKLTYLWSFVTQIFRYGYPTQGGDSKIFEVMTST
jgi:hypothetical protein